MAGDAADLPGLLDALPDGVLVADANGVVRHLNARAVEMLGPAAAVGVPLRDAVALQDLDGRGWFDCLRPYDGVPTRRTLVERGWFLPDGTELLVTARISRSDPRSPVQQVGVVLRGARERARVDRERADLVASMAHELRSPLTGLKGFTATLLQRWDLFGDDQKKLIMQSVHNDTDRLTRLITDLLEVARIDTGRLPLFAEPMDPAPAIDAVAQSVSAGSGREVRVQVAEGTRRVMADRDRFCQVLTNLAENAVRHGDGVVSIATDTREVDGLLMVLVSVEDQGRGIESELRRRVFTKYWKHGSRAGSGLGMYIAHGLVVAHGGRIEITDAASGGARIEVLWPAAEGFPGPS